MLKNLLAFPLVRLCGEIVVFAAAATAYEFAVRGRGVSSTIDDWVTLGLLVAVVVLVERYTSGDRPRDVGFDPRRVTGDTLAGLALGAGLFGAVILEMYAAGGYRIAAIHWSWAPVIAAIIVLPAAAIEEILLRGIVFRLVSQWAGTWIALGVSAVLFGLLHAFNPGATAFSTLAIALEAGVLLAAAYVATGNLWMPIALHFAWNFCEGPIFGTALSGGTVAQPLFAAGVAGSALLSGGRFGPEAGLPAVLTCLIAAVALLAYARRRGSIVACPWFRRPHAPG